MMVDFRENPLKSIDGVAVIGMEDYQKSTYTDLINGETSTIDLPKSNVLIYNTEDGTRIAARPSGTEPKIKFYVSVNKPLGQVSDYPAVHNELESKIDRILRELNLNS
jgi:phosphoglucomutase